VIERVLDEIEALVPGATRRSFNGVAEVVLPSSARNSLEFSTTGAGGAEGNRTPDLCSAIAALSHLSYSPAPGERPI
jgi:hypothetical protein